MSYITSPTYTGPNRVTCSPGYPTTTTCKLLVATLYNPTSDLVTVVVNGVSYVSGTDFTLRARGSNICWTEVLTGTGLSALTRYPWSVSQEASGTNYSDSGSLLTAAESGDDFTILFAGCDNNTHFTNQINSNPWKVPGAWQHYRTYAENSANLPVAGVLFVDDLGYVDGQAIDESGSAGTGTYDFPGITGLVCSNSPATSGALDDYIIGWCAIFGMLGPSQSTFTDAELVDTSLLRVLWGREENRAWCRKNLNVFPQWGDHEFMNDMGWDNQPGGATINQWTNGKLSWGYFYGAIQPPLTGVSVARDAIANHWAFKIGDVVIASLDGVTNASRTWGSPATVAVGNSAALTQFTTVYGNNQIDDILEAVNTLAGRYTILPLAHSIRYLTARTGAAPHLTFAAAVSESNYGAQHPIFDHCIANYQRIFTATGATPKSLMDNPVTNGTTGNLLLLHGDFHHGQVLYHNHAAYTGNAAENFYAVHLGTTNGSSNFPVPEEGATGASVADIYVEYQSPATSVNSMFWGAFLEVQDSARWLEVTYTDRDNTSLWNKKFMRNGGNYAFDVTWEFPSITGLARLK